MKIAKNRLLVGLFCTCLMACAGIVSGWGWTRYGRDVVTTTLAKQITIEVKKQEGSPLVITGAYADSGGLRPRYGYSVTNITDKLIRAYTIRHDVLFGKELAQQTGDDFRLRVTEDQFLKPNQLVQELEGGYSKYSEEVNKIVLSVDFVEFADGSTWGDDFSNSAERVAGYCAGIRTAAEGYGQKLESNLYDVFSKDIERNAVDFALQVDKSKSSFWKDGFINGIGIVRNRISALSQKNGSSAVREEIQKLHSAVDGRQEK